MPAPRAPHAMLRSALCACAVRRMCASLPRTALRRAPGMERSLLSLLGGCTLPVALARKGARALQLSLPVFFFLCPVPLPATSRGSPSMSQAGGGIELYAHGGGTITATLDGCSVYDNFAAQVGCPTLPPCRSSEGPLPLLCCTRAPLSLPLLP